MSSKNCSEAVNFFFSYHALGSRWLKLIIIPSGKPKIWDKYPDIGAVKAKEAYTGTFHLLCQEYAEQFHDNYVILSPKFGVLFPNENVSHTYDVRFTQKGVNDQTINLASLRKQWEQIDLHDEEIIPVLGGKKYKPLMNSIDQNKHNFIYPLHGLGGIGYMQKALNEAIKKRVPLK